MFVDTAKIFIQAGKGGDGIVSFRREKYVPAGGPDGGDGGRGGDIVFKVDEGLSTLMDFKYKRKYKAQPGTSGGPNNRTGKSGETLVINVPPGTIIKDEDTGLVVADLIDAGDSFAAAKGGRGGKGNARFATSTRQVPKFAEQGEEGESRQIVLELKLLADVGLVGYPNVGKSTLLSTVTSARPKIADYHFTTLEPNLGVVRLDDGTSFVIADIPGLIEGAHKGVGLGHQFLRHIERTRVVIHVVDVSGIEGRNPLEDFIKINSELKEYSPVLAEKVQIVAANKMDIPSAGENMARLREQLNQDGYEIFPVSAATGEGIKELLYRAAQLLRDIPVIPRIETDEAAGKAVYDYNDRGWLIRKEEDVFIIEGRAIERVMRRVNLDDAESLQYFQRTIKRMGIADELEKQGINEGDTVKIKDLEFEYIR